MPCDPKNYFGFTFDEFTELKCRKLSNFMVTTSSVNSHFIACPLSDISSTKKQTKQTICNGNRTDNHTSDSKRS